MEPVTKQLDEYLAQEPRVGKGVFIARGAVIVGAVDLGDFSNIWYNAVLRADINRIIVGHHTNIQDNAVIHLEDNTPCRIGNYVTIGHAAIIHACTIADETLIGMGSVILDRAKIGRHCIIGAKALVTRNMEIPDGSLVMGMPAKVIRPLTAAERESLKPTAEKYSRIAAYCLENKLMFVPPSV